MLRREYVQRIFSRSFIATTLLIFTPIAFFAVGALFAPRLSPPSVASGGPLRPDLVNNSGAIGAAAVSVILFFIMVLSLVLWGTIVMRAVLEEKQSRVLEVLLCFASPEELMAGKILGIGALSTTQVLIWLSLGVGLVLSNPIGRATEMMMHLGPSAVIYFLVFEALGYLLYTAVFCALGAVFDSAEEAQQWSMFLVLPSISGTMALLPTVLSNPNSGLAVGASIFPITAPALMYARVLIGDPPIWQVVLSLGLLVTSVWITIWLCARIYRVGILMYGKRPTIREIARWLRYA